MENNSCFFQSLFFSLLIGLFVHIVIVPTYMRTSNIYTTIFSVHLLNIEKSRIVMENLKNNLDHLEEELRLLELLNRVNEIAEYNSTTIRHEPDHLSQLKNSYNNRIRICDSIIQNNETCFLQNTAKHFMRNFGEDSRLNTEQIDHAIAIINNDLVDIHNFYYTYCSNDSLKKIISRNDSLKCDPRYNHIYNHFFSGQLPAVKGPVLISICNKDIALYPDLFVLNSYIVLLLAFIIQLIITGKSVTEPL